MATIDLYIDTTAGQLVAGPTLTTVVQANSLPFNFGDTPTLRVFLLAKQAVLNTATPYTIINNAGLQLFLYFDDGIIAATIFTQVIVWTASSDNTYFTADLPLNTVALNTLIGVSTSGSCYIKVGYVQNGKTTTVLSKQVIVGVGLPGAAIAPAPAGQTALSAEVASLTYFPQQPVNGKPIYLASPSGKIIALYAIDNATGGVSLAPSQVN